MEQMERNPNPSPNQEIVALLTQINDSLARSNRRERRANVLLFINSLGTILLIAAIILAAAVIIPRAQALVNEVESVLQVMQNANLDKVAQEIQGFANIGAEAMEGITEAAGKLKSLDMQALNDAVGELTNTAKSFALINFGNLNDAIANMNEAITKLNGITGKMANFFRIG